MEKKEKKSDLEGLLNSLIEKGWKPFGMDNYDRFIIERAGDMCFRWKYPGADGESAFDYNYDYFKIREIASKESGLWQFVCENEMVKIEYGKIREKYDETSPTTDKNKIITYRQLLGEDNYEYRLIESALCDEDKLEEFLLSNIKVDVDSRG